MTMTYWLLQPGGVQPSYDLRATYLGNLLQNVSSVLFIYFFISDSNVHEREAGHDTAVAQYPHLCHIPQAFFGWRAARFQRSKVCYPQSPTCEPAKSGAQYYPRHSLRSGNVYICISSLPFLPYRLSRNLLRSSPCSPPSQRASMSSTRTRAATACSCAPFWTTSVSSLASPKRLGA